MGLVCPVPRERLSSRPSAGLTCHAVPSASRRVESLAMPGNHSRCFDDEDAGPPFAKDGRETDPQDSIRNGQLRPLHRPLQNTELMAQSEDLNLERRPPAELC